MIAELVGSALAAACGDARVLARIGGPIGEAARTAARELAQLSGVAHKAKRAAWVAAAVSPLPAGFRGADPSWIEARLRELPARARGAIAIASNDPVDIWLARLAVAGIPPLPPVRTGAVRGLADAVALDGKQLASWLARVGKGQVAELAAKPTRAVIARCAGFATIDEVALVLIGARTIAPLVAGTLAARQLVVRLPMAVGVRVAQEFVRHATDPSPTWTALAAG